MTRIRPTNANFLNELFLIHEQRVKRSKPKDINGKKLSKIKKVIDKISKKPSVESNSIDIFEDFSPFTAHLLKNKALAEICKELFGISLSDSNLTRYHHFISDKSKTILYINFKPMSNIDEGITVIDDLGKTLRVDESGQIEGTYCSKLNIDGRKVEVVFKYYIGFMKEG